MRIQKKLALAFLPLTLVILACTCSNQDRFVTPTPPPTPTPAPIVVPTPLATEAIAEVSAADALLVNLYERTNPAVVYIEVLADDGSTQMPLGSGSGFIIDEEGSIVTNAHVVEQADVVQVTFSNGHVTNAQIVGQDPYADLAVIRADDTPAGVLPLELGDADSLRVGQRVIAIGNPFGLEGTMTVGIISALGRTLPAQILESTGRFSNPEIIQTDAAINPGNSGGPLLDIQARVVGVNTAIRSTTGVNSGIGFAVPVDTLKRILPTLLEEGTYHYPYLGITSDNRFTVAELADPLDLPVTYGVLISSVQPNTAADQAGLRGGDREVQVQGMTITAGGDIIIAVDNQRIETFDDLIAYLVLETEVGQEVMLTIMRDGREMEIPVTLGER